MMAKVRGAKQLPPAGGILGVFTSGYGQIT